MRTRALGAWAKLAAEASKLRAETVSSLAASIGWVGMSDISDATKLEKGWTRSVSRVVKLVIWRANGGSVAMGT
jgi:hypothetical protein